MPDTVKFVLVVGSLVGAVYGSAWMLSHFPPQQTEIVKPLPSEKLRAK
ncbi:MAG: histidine kinase [Aestuariivirga sp.]|nr:histidine kinase [Aestuariivirga sp.]MCA3560342.1 histidine kinase [Aestuariivirga sp.]